MRASHGNNAARQFTGESDCPESWSEFRDVWCGANSSEFDESGSRQHATTNYSAESYSALSRRGSDQRRGSVVGREYSPTKGVGPSGSAPFVLVVRRGDEFLLRQEIHRWNQNEDKERRVDRHVCKGN